ncbi:hypothetical protein [Rhodococcus koreensis]|uniref:hypothetical protein n=1 Tax=Rhodococcus koreensis TaxID=99653 RepID=UPI00366BF504
MSTKNHGSVDAFPQRDEDDDDLDLLTYNEARVRLTEEVAVEEQRLADLRQRAETEPNAALDHTISGSVRRLDGLQDALRRTSTHAITEANAAEFYGRDPKEFHT